jgi:uncharacterized protein YndB with AHSA1/START domain
MSDYKFVAEPGQLSVVQSCLIDADPKDVFQVLIDPVAIPNIWGPVDLVTEVEVLDAQPGGKWRYIQTDSSGEVYAFHGTFHVINPPNQLVYTFEYEGEPGQIALEEISFHSEDRKTRIIDTTVFLNQSARDGMVQAGMESGARETFERITAFLSKKG